VGHPTTRDLDRSAAIANSLPVGDRIADARGESDSREAPEIDLTELVHVLKEYKWLIGGVTALVLAAGVLWTLATPKIYEATATLEYDPNPSRPQPWPSPGCVVPVLSSTPLPAFHRPVLPQYYETV